MRLDKNSRRIIWLIGLAGLLLFIAVIGYQGVSVISAAVVSVGSGLFWVAVFHLILESLGQAIRSAAFVVPAALGIQEGGYLVLGVSIGIAPETAVALSLVKRVRELGLGLPALLLWQRIEAKQFRRQ